MYSKRLAMGLLLKQKRYNEKKSLDDYAKVMGLSPKYIDWIERGGAPVNKTFREALIYFIAGKLSCPFYAALTEKTIALDKCYTPDEQSELESSFAEVLTMFDFEEDRQLYRNLLAYRSPISSPPFEFYKTTLPGDLQYQSYINRDIIKTVLEGGVNDGFFTRCFLNFADMVIGFEPFYECWERSTIREKIDEKRVQVLPLTLWRKKQKVYFWEHPHNSHCSKVVEEPCEGNIKTLNATSVDAFVQGTNLFIDYIKLDTEGAEMPILEGALQTITQQRPQLALSIYHSKEDMYRIPLFCKNHLSDYSYRLAHYCLGHTETILYCIPTEKIHQDYFMHA